MVKLATSGTTVGVTAFLIFLILLFPADRAYSLMKDNLPVVLYDISGTIWSGRAGAAVLEKRVMRALNWSVRPWAVFLGRLDLDITFDSGDIKGDGTVGFSLAKKLRFTDVQAQVPPSELQSLLAPKLPPLVQLQGSVNLDAEKIIVDQAANRAEYVKGTLIWRDAAISGFKEPLGAFRVLFDTVDDTVVGLITSEGTDGPVIAEGKLTLDKDGKYDVNIQLAARDRARQDIGHALRFLGQVGADGKVTIVQKGTL